MVRERDNTIRSLTNLKSILTNWNTMVLTKTTLLFLILILSLNNLIFAQAAEDDAIIGTWLMPDDDGIIEICKDDEYFFGKILWMQETEEDGSPLKDKENPVDSLQNREVAGLRVMNNFKYNGDNSWVGGTFYAAKKGIVAEPDFELIGKDHLNICISFFIFSKTIELARVDTALFFQNRKSLEK